MAFATTVKLGEGTKLEYEDTTWKELLFAKELPALGETGSFVDVTPLRSTVKVYAAGEADTQELEFVLFDVPGDTDHQNFFTKANSATSLNMRITYTSGRIGTFLAELNRAMVNPPARGEGLTVTVKARQSGAVTWTATA